MAKKKLGSIMGFAFMQFDLSLNEKYFKHMETHFQEELKFIEKEYDNFKLRLENNDTETGWSEEAIDFFMESFHDDKFLMKDIYLQKFRESQIFQSYSFIEDKLMSGCKNYAQNITESNSIEELKGQNDLDRIKKFLTTTIGFSMSIINEEWQFLNNLRLVRNKIVHHNGKLKKTDNHYNTIRAFSKDKFSLKPYPSDSSEVFEIILDKKMFIHKIILNTSNMFKKIADYEVD